jgi:hypothetical protein
MHKGARAVCISVHVPEMEVHARGEDRKDHDLEIIKQVLVGVLKEQRCEYIHQWEYFREEK